MNYYVDTDGGRTPSVFGSPPCKGERGSKLPPTLASGRCLCHALECR